MLVIPFPAVSDFDRAAMADAVTVEEQLGPLYIRKALSGLVAKSVGFGHGFLAPKFAMSADAMPCAAAN